MENYLKLVECAMYLGESREDRTGVGTHSLFGKQLRFDLKRGFPLLTNKYTSFKLILSELLWFLSGSTNVKDLHKNNNHIWDEWANKDGNLGPVYGKQWVDWEINQIQGVIDDIQKNPFSRRHIVSAWNVADLPAMALVPCHVLFQFYVNNKKELSCHMYQRSADLFLGVPFNIASYALLTHMVAKVCDLGVNELIISFGDVHVYKNHFSATKLMLGSTSYTLPTISFEKKEIIFDYKMEDFTLNNYRSGPKISAEVAI